MFSKKHTASYPSNNGNVMVNEIIMIYNRIKSNDKSVNCKQIYQKSLIKDRKYYKNYKCNENSVVNTLKTDVKINTNGKPIYKYVNVGIKMINKLIINFKYDDIYGKIPNCNVIKCKNNGEKPNYTYVNIVINLESIKNIINNDGEPMYNTNKNASHSNTIRDDVKTFRCHSLVQKQMHINPHINQHFTLQMIEEYYDYFPAKSGGISHKMLMNDWYNSKQKLLVQFAIKKSNENYALFNKPNLEKCIEIISNFHRYYICLFVCLL